MPSRTLLAQTRWIQRLILLDDFSISGETRIRSEIRLRPADSPDLLAHQMDTNATDLYTGFRYGNALGGFSFIFMAFRRAATTHAA